jgi:hypothetical protein
MKSSGSSSSMEDISLSISRSPSPYPFIKSNSISNFKDKNYNNDNSSNEIYNENKCSYWCRCSIIRGCLYLISSLFYIGQIISYFQNKYHTKHHPEEDFNNTKIKTYIIYLIVLPVILFIGLIVLEIYRVILINENRKFKISLILSNPDFNFNQLNYNYGLNLEKITILLLFITTDITFILNIISSMLVIIDFKYYSIVPSIMIYGSSPFIVCNIAIPLLLSIIYTIYFIPRKLYNSITKKGLTRLDF